MADAAQFDSLFPFEFTYVRIPADESLPFEDLTGTAKKAGDMMQQHIAKAHFAGGSIKHADGLRAQYGEAVDEKMGVLNRVCAEGSVETFALVRPSRSTQPEPHTGTYLYLDEMGVPKGLPVNKRASKVATACGLDVESPFHGDVYIARVRIEPSPARQSSFYASELASGSAWLESAASENWQYNNAMSEYTAAAKAAQLRAEGKTEAQVMEEEAARGWRWQDSAEEVEVTVAVPEGVAAKALKVDVSATALSVALKAEPTKPIASFVLFAPVRPDESAWTMGKTQEGTPAVVVSMEKVDAQSWEMLEAASKGSIL